MTPLTEIRPSEKLKALAPDLTISYPRSPRNTLGGYVIAARVLDKCRAVLNGTNGEYKFACPLDQRFFTFSGIEPEAFKHFVATGASDVEVAQWIQTHAKQKERQDVIVWNNEQRYQTLKDLPPEKQVFMEDYINENLPQDSLIRFFFDIFDIEEKRL